MKVKGIVENIVTLKYRKEVEVEIPESELKNVNLTLEKIARNPHSPSCKLLTSSWLIAEAKR